MAGVAERLSSIACVIGTRTELNRLEYRSGDRLQLHKLLDSADHFDVPAAYVLYCGNPAYRAGLSCGPGHSTAKCSTCARSGVSVLAGPCAKYIVEHGLTAEDAFDGRRPSRMSSPQSLRTGKSSTSTFGALRRTYAVFSSIHSRGRG